MKLWISREALNGVIFEINARIVEDNGPYHGNAYTDPRDKFDASTIFSPGQYHISRGDAVRRAEEMRRGAIARCEEEINRLKGLVF